ncbi:MAG: glycosyltransferase [Planctomycetales bacterium]|nr:glycosyltransferase [Planctomycetales bacterium]
MAGRVTFLGPVADLAPLYAAADLLLAPTFYDPAPLATLEAMACGTPVATTRASGHADLAAEAGGEVLADPWDAAALAGAVVAVLDRARDGALVARARAVAERHDWARHVEALEGIYREATAARARASAASMEGPFASV